MRSDRLIGDVAAAVSQDSFFLCLGFKFLRLRRMTIQTDCKIIKQWHKTWISKREKTVQTHRITMMLPTILAGWLCVRRTMYTRKAFFHRFKKLFAYNYIYLEHFERPMAAMHFSSVKIAAASLIDKIKYSSFFCVIFALLFVFKDFHLIWYRVPRNCLRSGCRSKVSDFNLWPERQGERASALKTMRR